MMPSFQICIAVTSFITKIIFPKFICLDVRKVLAFFPF